MGKIFRYECRRLLWNKFFIGLAVVLLLYGALVLHAVTILGVLSASLRRTTWKNWIKPNWRIVLQSFFLTLASITCDILSAHDSVKARMISSLSNR